MFLFCFELNKLKCVLIFIKYILSQKCQLFCNDSPNCLLIIIYFNKVCSKTLSNNLTLFQLTYFNDTIMPFN